MKLQAALLLLFFGFLIGCKARTAFDYSQKIVKIETQLASEIVEADQKVSRYLDANQNDSAAIITRQMEEMAESSLQQVRDLKAPDVKEGDNFKQAAVRYFTYLKTIYSSFNKFASATSDEAREAERQRLARIVADKDEAARSLQLAQQKFAAANNFRIEKEKK